MYKESAYQKLTHTNSASMEFNAEEQSIILSGNWSWRSINENELKLAYSKINNKFKKININGSKINYLDTSGIYFIDKIIKYLKSNQIEVSKLILSNDGQKLYDRFIDKLNEPIKNTQEQEQSGILINIGHSVVDMGKDVIGIISFFGQFCINCLLLIKSPRSLSTQEIIKTINNAGAKGLWIAILLSFMLGMTLAYEMSPQFRSYGANIYAVNFLGISLLKEVSPLMTAIIIAGRTGSAIAAEIGTMKTQEEIDAIQTMGISPIIRLVLPKVFGTMIITPLITAIADVASLLGGAIVVNYTLDLNYSFFLERLQNNVSIYNYTDGIYKSLAFGFIISLIGCYCGFNVKGNANSIGEYTTKSVVLGIFSIVCIDAIFAIIFEILKI